jgi:hypothetical protein
MRNAKRVPASHGLAIVAIAGLLVIPAMTAGAEIVEGPCDGSVTFSDSGLTVAASAPADTAIEIPSSDTVSYEGSIDIAVPADPVDVSGEVTISLPFGHWRVANWSGQTAEVAKTGTYTYTAPSWVPRGSGPVPIEIVHTHGDVVCRATFQGAISGSPWNVVSGLLLLGTVVFGIAMLAAGAKTTKGGGRPVLGLVSGFLFGLLGAASLFAFGATALNSPMFWILPLVGIVVGVGMSAWAPFGSGPQQPAGPGTGTGTPADTTITIPDLETAGTATPAPDDPEASDQSGLMT